MKHIFIVNPISGKLAAKNSINDIHSIALKHHLDYEVIETKCRKHATEIAKRYTNKDQVCLYSVGGDGTLNEIVNGLNQQVPLAILPFGSGNDFNRMISAKEQLNPELIEATIFGKLVEIDSGITNTHQFINCLSMGFDANINDLANKMLRKTILPKKLSYLTSSLINIIKPKPLDLEINIDGKFYNDKYLLVAIMNGQFYGGGFRPCPESILNDGYLDICLIKDLPIHKIIQLISKFYKGEHTSLKECTLLKAKTIQINANKPILMQSDGEGFTVSKISVSIQENNIKLKVPVSSPLI